MKESTKKARQNKKIAELLGLDVKEVEALRSKDEADDVMREAQAIFLFLEKPEAFINKKCDQCHNFFLTTYQFVSVCSTQCRINSLEKIGIDWNPLHTPEERWKRAKIPTEYSIPPKALQILLELAQLQQEREHSKQLGEYFQQVSEPLESVASTVQSNNDSQESLVESPPPLNVSVSEVSAEEFDPYQLL
jgi:hypothetical protein